MENYQVSARKYRPSTFDTVVGQKALTVTLRNAIAADRLAHAYLFCGSRGVGKTSCARIFAKTINCTNPTPEGNPCNECASCTAFNNNRSMNIVELDAASNNSVENMRELIDQVRIPPADGKYRVFIIDEVHMLSTAAFNAFLKTLEEPPSYVIFILATTEKHKILPTILSRCQIYDFNRITIEDIVNHLEYVAKNEGIAAERSALTVIAEKADGAMRDALSIFDQVAACSGGNITYQSAIDSLNVLDRAVYSRLFAAIKAEDIPQCLLIFKEIRDRGFDTQFFISGLAKYVRTLMLASDAATLPMLDYEPEQMEAVKLEAAQFTPKFYYSAMSLINDADLNFRLASDKTFHTELLLIKLCQLLSPCSDNNGNEQGQLKPFAVPASSAPQSAAQAPVPTPAAPVTAAAPVRQSAQPAAATRTPRRHSGPSLKDLERKSAEDKAVTVTRAERTEPYTQQQLNAAWDSFMALHPADHILLSALRIGYPQPVSEGSDEYVLTIENHIQETELNERRAELYAHIHNALSNDKWTLVLEVNTGEGSPETWNDREVLAYELEENEPFRKLYHLFKLKL